MTGKYVYVRSSKVVLENFKLSEFPGFFFKIEFTPCKAEPVFGHLTQIAPPQVDS